MFSLLKHKPVESRHENYESQILKKLKATPYGVHSHELANITYKFSTYISDLRKDGYQITAVRVSGQHFKYYYTEQPEGASER